MNRINPKFILLSVLCILCFTNAEASRKKKPRSRDPKAIIVQLRVEQNRIEALTKNNDFTKLATLKSDRDKVVRAIINDFSDNFSYCPVYYFMDSNYDAIENKKFTGILLDKDLKPVVKPIIQPDSDYLIVSYGLPCIKTKYSDKKEDRSAYIHDVVAEEYQSFMIYDNNMNLVSHYFRLKADDAFLKSTNSKKYYYSSKEFILEYFPCAKMLNWALTYNPTRMKRKVRMGGL